MRRIFYSLALMLLAANMLATDAIIDGIKYKLDEQNNTASVTYNISGPDVPNYNQLSGVVVIPATISYSGTYTVTSIGFSAFEKAPSITEIVLPNTIIRIEEYAFHHCDELKKVDIPSSVTYLGDFAFRSCGKLTTVNIPAGIKKIGTYTFSYCEALKDFYVPATVDTIRTMAFSYCKLNNVYIMRPTPPVTEEMPCYSGSGHEPKLIVPYGSQAAYQADANWNNLEMAEMPKPSFDGLYYDFNEAAQTATLTYELKQKSINYIGLPETVTLPATVNNDKSYALTAIGDFALAYNRSVESLIVPAGVTAIGNSAFEVCEKLSAISLPEGVESIGSFCFNLCKQLQSVRLPGGLLSLGSLAFYQCASLSTVSLPSTLVTMEDNAFDGCTALSTLTNYNPVPQNIAANVFNKVNVANVTLRVPKGSLSAYQNAAVWQDFNIVEFDPKEGIDEVSQQPKANSQKLIKNGQLLIERNGKMYNANGTQIK